MSALTWWSAVASFLHLVALGIGMGAIYVRARTLRGPLDEGAIQRILTADTLWGLAAALWIGSGLWRVFGTVAKTSVYYLHNHVFYAKMALFLLVFALEIWPMVTLIKWRIALGKKQPIDTSKARALGMISYVEFRLLFIIILLATLMARGVGMIS